MKILHFAKVVGPGDFKIQISGEILPVIFEFQSSVAEPNQMLDIFQKMFSDTNSSHLNDGNNFL